MYRLLIVDDEKDICENIKYLLDWSLYNITSILTATSYAEAVSKAVDFQPHIALLDINLGDHWGYELAEHLRSMGMQTIFCMISGYDDFNYVHKSMQATARDYLLKPIHVAELRAFIERTIVRDLHGVIPEHAASQPELDPVLQVEYSKFSKITNKIILIVKSNYRSSQSLTNIAEIFNMSSKYIGRIFLKDTGIKFSEYLTAYRMIQARRLIENTQEKISVIANMVGYSQLNNFYVHFKNYYNISPSTLRNFSASVPVAGAALTSPSPQEAPFEEGGSPSCDETRPAGPRTPNCTPVHRAAGCTPAGPGHFRSAGGDCQPGLLHHWRAG